MPPLTLDQLTRLTRFDREHAQAVRTLAVELFRRTALYHGLPESFLSVLGAGAWLHDLGYHENPPRHQERGRELVLQNGIEGFDWREMVMIACLVGYHREKVRPKNDPLFQSLDPDTRHVLLRLAAIVRVADGLDFTHNAIIQLVELTETARGAFLRVQAPPEHDSGRDLNIARANKKADLWNRVMPVPLFIVGPEAKITPYPYITPQSTLRDAGARVLSFYLDRMRSHEQGVRAGVDPEEVHDMRVATRRLRAGMRVFRAAFGRKPLAPFLEDVRWLAAGLGKVRDADVLLGWLTEYCPEAPRSHKRPLEQFIGYLIERRAQDHVELTGQLDSERFHGFVRGFQDFLADRSGAPEEGDKSVGGTAPKRIEREWRRVLSYQSQLHETTGPEIFHRIRIAAKQCRYTAEFFRECYRGKTSFLIEQLVAVQDALGIVHDVDMHIATVRDYEKSLRLTGSAAVRTRRALQRIVETRLGEQTQQREAFLAIWKQLGGESFAGRMKRLIRKMQKK